VFTRSADGRLRTAESPIGLGTGGLRSAVRACLVLAVVPICLLGLVHPAVAAPRTTAPGQVYIVPVTLTDKAIIIPKDKFSKGRKFPRLPRAAAIQYRVTNKGSRPYVLQMWKSKTTVIKPGKVDTILLNWNFRGTYTYETLYHGKPFGPRGHITIF
jgi:hypothetical protein